MRGYESCAMLTKGRSGDVQSPSPVTFERNGAGVTTRLLLFHVDHHMAMGPFMILNASNIFFSLTLIFKQFFKTTAAALVVLLQLQL